MPRYPLGVKVQNDPEMEGYPFGSWTHGRVFKSGKPPNRVSIFPGLSAVLLVGGTLKGMWKESGPIRDFRPHFLDDDLFQSKRQRPLTFLCCNRCQSWQPQGRPCVPNPLVAIKYSNLGNGESQQRAERPLVSAGGGFPFIGSSKNWD